MFRDADVCELLLFYESHRVTRKLAHVEIEIVGRNLLGHVTVGFTCYRADQEPKFHHVENQSNIVVFFKAVGYMSQDNFYHLHSGDQPWQGNWIQFMRFTQDTDHPRFEVIEGASVYPPALQPRVHRRPFPMEENDQELVDNLFLNSQF